MLSRKKLLPVLSLAALAALGANTSLADTSYQLEYPNDPTGVGCCYYFSVNAVNGINVSGTLLATENADGVDGGSDSFAALWDTAGNHIGLTTPYLGKTAADTSRAVAINASGQALVTEAGSLYLVTNGTRSIVQMGLLQPYATSMNDSAMIVGRFPVTVNGTAQTHAFVFANGLATDLGTLPGALGSGANDINNLGHVVGSALLSTTTSHAVLWRDGAIIDLGTLPGDTSSTAIAINDLGQIVGTSTGANGTRGFLWDKGVMTELGAFGSNKFIQPRDISNAGQIVGVAFPTSPSREEYGTAFSWSNGAYRNVNTIIGQAGSLGCGAYAVNDSGYIAGQCGLVFRLTPVPDAVDVSLDMTQSPTIHAHVNDPLVYTLRVANTGSLPAIGVTITDTLPTKATFVSASSSQGECAGNSTITCTIGDLAPGTEATATITVIPTEKMFNLYNTASVAASETDVSPLNNKAALYIDVQAPAIYADMGVTMVASPSQIKRNQTASYIMTVTNNGPQTAQNVFLTNSFSTAFTSLTTTQGTCSTSDPNYPTIITANCSIGTLAPGAKATVTMKIKPSSTGTYTNKATVSATVIDGNSSNNTASASIKVVK